MTNSSPAGGRGQSNRGGRGNRAAGIGGQGAGRERHRCRRELHRDYAGGERPPPHSGRRRRPRHGPRRAAACAGPPRHLQTHRGRRSLVDQDPRLPRRGASLHCRRQPADAHQPPGRVRQRLVDRSRRRRPRRVYARRPPAGDHRRGGGPLLCHAGTAQVPQGATHRIGAIPRIPSTALPCAIRPSASPWSTTAAPCCATGRTRTHRLERLARLALVMGRDFANNALPIDAERDGVHLTGYAALPTLNRASAQHQYLFVNGRPVRDRLLHGAVRAAYADFLHRGRHPMAALFVDLAPDMVGRERSPDEGRGALSRYGPGARPHRRRTQARARRRRASCGDDCCRRRPCRAPNRTQERAAAVAVAPPIGATAPRRHPGHRCWPKPMPAFRRRWIRPSARIERPPPDCRDYGTGGGDRGTTACGLSLGSRPRAGTRHLRRGPDRRRHRHRRSARRPRAHSSTSG